MRCTECDYPLWNLKARECPECGASFAPSEYEFVVESVEFCCPHCQQSYYGTGVKGHLVPAEFDCITCGRHIHMDEMILRPASGVSESQTQRDEVPWHQRKTRSWWRSWFVTVGMSMGQPMRLMRATPPSDATEQAWRFALTTAFLIGLVGYAIPLSVIAAFMMTGDPNFAMVMALTAAGSLIAMPLSNLIIIGIWGAVTHGILALTGGTNEGIGRTYQALCYSSGVNAPQIAPCVALCYSSGVNAPQIAPCVGPYCLSYMTGIWWIVSATLMIKQAHRISGGRATLATISLPVSMIVLFVLLYLGLIFIQIGMVRTTTGPAMTAMSQAQIMTDAVIGYAAQHDNTEPPHAAALVGDNLASPWDFVVGVSSTDPAAIQVTDSITLDELQFTDVESQQAYARQAAEKLPDNVVAHRLGDYVFTYHGMDFASDDGRLWIVIESVQGGGGSMIWIGRLDGTVTLEPTSSFANALQAQNQLRAAAGLPPLVDPLRVTHTDPEVADDSESQSDL